MSGVGGAFRRVGRVLSGVGGDVGHHAALVEGKGSSTSPVNERGDETPTVVPGAVGRTEHERAAEDGLRVQMDEMRMDLKNVLDSLGTFSSWLGETERGLDRVCKAASGERSSNTESASEVRSTTGGAASKGDVGEEESGAFEKLLQARKVSVDVMEGVRGRPTPDDSSLSPTKRLERAMKGLEDDVEVQRSPQQVRRRAAEIADEVAEESRRVQEAIADRGRVLVDRYGYEGAATRISEMFKIESFEAVVRALEVAFPGAGEAAAGQLTTRTRRTRRPRIRVLAVEMGTTIRVASRTNLSRSLTLKRSSMCMLMVRVLARSCCLRTMATGGRRCV